MGLRAPQTLIRLLAAVLAGGVLIVQCKKSDGVRFYHEDFPEKLADWRLFTDAHLTPAPGVLPYDLNSPLFSDYASKLRTIWMPAGTKAQYEASGGLIDFPKETIFSKTFYYPGPNGQRRLLETRLLIHTDEGWVGLPYIWNEEQTEAVLSMAGGTKQVTYEHANGKRFDFTYTIPEAGACRGCHIQQTGFDKKMVPIGPRGDNLNRDFDYSLIPADYRGDAKTVRNQLDAWQAAGYLEGLPPADRRPRMVAYDHPDDGTLAQRARAYLHSNCAHCHTATGPANTSGLLLNVEMNDENHFGVCKTPVAAGRGSGGLFFDILPGDPARSILWFRMDSSDPGVMMPELARTLRHQEGLDLIAAWIREKKSFNATNCAN